MPLHKDHCYVIAEVGSNWNWMGLASCRAHIYQASKTGADAVKFQLFKLEDILVKVDLEGRPGECGDRSTELNPDWIPELAGLCREYHMDFLCTPFAPWAVDVLNPHVWAFKIGSFEHKRLDIWKAVHATGKPIIFSAGRGGYPVEYGDNIIGALYCVSKYPTQPSDIYLGNIDQIAESSFNGFSDHTTSTVIPALAVARGARIIEKHFRCDTVTDASPDYPHSLTPRQFTEMVDNIRLAELTCWRQPPAERTLEQYPNRRE